MRMNGAVGKKRTVPHRALCWLLAAVLCASLVPSCAFTRVAEALGGTVEVQSSVTGSGDITLRSGGSQGADLQVSTGSTVAVDVKDNSGSYVAQVRYSTDGGTTYTALSSDDGYTFKVPEDAESVQVCADYVSKVWDGTVDVTWFDPVTYSPEEGSDIDEQTDYYLTYPAQVAGLAALVNGIFNDYPATPVLDANNNVQTYKGKGGAAKYLNGKTIVRPDVEKKTVEKKDEDGNVVKDKDGNVETEAVNGAHLDGSKLYNSYTSEGQQSGRITDSQNGYALADERTTTTVLVGDASMIGAKYEVNEGQNSQNLSTTNDYYIGIYSFNGKTIHLTADMDFGGKLNSDGTYSTESPNYMPVGGQYCMLPDNGYSKLSASFNGVFDGGGHSITNLYCERYANTEYGDSQSVGIVGRLGVHDSDDADERPVNPAVRNIVLESGLVSARRSLGGIVGKTGKTSFNNRDGSVGSIIENCINKATVYGTDKKGTAGIVGAAYNGGVIRNCANFGPIYNKLSVGTPTGGIAGRNENTIVNCYNVGTIKAQIGNSDVESSTFAEAIGTRNGDFNHYVGNCWWLTGSADSGYYGTLAGTGGDGEGSCTEFGAGTDHRKLVAKDLNTKFSSPWRDVEGINVVDGVGYPSLWFQSEKVQSCTITIEQPEHGTIAVRSAYGNGVSYPNGSKVEAGTLLEFVYKPDAGYVCRNWAVNGESLDEELLTVTSDITVSAEISKCKSTTISLPTDSKAYTLSVTKKGVVEEGDTFKSVEDYAVKDGDTIYEGDVLTFEAKPVEGAKPADEGYEYLDTFTYYANGYTMRNGMLTVSKEQCENPLQITIMRDITERTWNNYVVNTAKKDPEYANWYNSGSSDTTEYVLDSAADLAWLSQIVYTGTTTFEGITIKLGADIDMTDLPEDAAKLFWVPIGMDSTTCAFQGTFDGCGHSVTLGDIVFTNYGGLFGVVGKKGTVRNVAVKGSVSAGWYTGGIVGSLEGGTVENCVNEAAVSGSEEFSSAFHVGGIVGYSTGGTISGCVNLGDVSGTEFVGGIIGTAGYANAPLKIQSCYSTGAVSAEREGAGGIAGYLSGPTARKKTTLSNCYVAGKVTAQDEIGALVGYALKNCTVQDSLFLEGVAGQAVGKINSPSTVDASGASQVSADKLKSSASALGSAFFDNQSSRNNGWPLLSVTAQDLLTVSFLDADGSTLQNTVCEAGATLEYRGKTPSKACTDSKHYVFKGWNASLQNIQESGKLTPLFDEEAHSYKSKVTTKATYAKKGARTYTCTVCKRSYTESIAKKKVTAKVKLAKSKTKSSKKKKVTVSWKKTSGVSGYQVYYKVSGKGAKYVKVSGASKKSTTIKKLTSKKKVKVKVRAYVKSGGKYYYGPWSSSKSVKVK